MNNFRSLSNNQENYTVAENDKYQIVEPYIGENIVKYGKNVVNYAKENANESYYFLFYTVIFLIVFAMLLLVCIKPGVILPPTNQEIAKSSHTVSILQFCFILLFYVGAIYYYTHISIFYFSESWERYTFIGYGTVLFITLVVFVGILGKKFTVFRNILKKLGPLKTKFKVKTEQEKLKEQMQQKRNQLNAKIQDQREQFQRQRAQKQAQRIKNQALQKAEMDKYQAVKKAEIQKQRVQKQAQFQKQQAQRKAKIQQQFKKKIANDLNNVSKQQRMLQKLQSSPSVRL